MARPRSGILWLTKPHVRPLLGQIATGQVPLTHEGIATLTPWRSAIYVRDLLVAVGTLPPVDRELFGFEQWLPRWLRQVEDEEHRKILTRYATWQVLRQLRAVADHGPIGHYRHQNARYRLRQAAVWLHDLDSEAPRTLAAGDSSTDGSPTRTPNSARQSERSWPGPAEITSCRLQLSLTIEPGPGPISRQQQIRLIRRHAMARAWT